MTRFVLVISFLLLFSQSIVFAEKTTIDFNVQENEVVFSFLPIENGESAIIHLPNNRVFLINAGTTKNEKEINQFLQQFQIKQVDGIILTAMIDARMLQRLQTKYDIKQLILLTPLAIDMNKFFPVQTSLVKGEKLELAEGIALDVKYDGNGVNFTISLHNNELFWIENINHQIETEHLSQELNNISIIKLPIWSKEYFVSEKFIHHLDPQTAIIGNNGESKKNEDLLEVFYETWVDVYYTKQNGLISIKFDKDNYEVLTFPKKEFISP
ncbi:hypothetical protein WAK64_09145 [Bacillus spongiae]|uniref:Hydrolase n=1 Tax=Bacillus spongiae TaxID=2683610 RepID=A0ABU8HD78_9BACI